MPSKYRKKLKACKEYYVQSATKRREKAQKVYEEHIEEVKYRNKARKLTDKTGQKKRKPLQRRESWQRIRLSARTIARDHCSTCLLYTSDAADE